MISEILCSIVSGGTSSKHFARKKGRGAGICYGFVVIDPDFFGDEQQIVTSLSALMQELRDANRQDENVAIYTHREKEHWPNNGIFARIS